MFGNGIDPKSMSFLTTLSQNAPALRPRRPMMPIDGTMGANSGQEPYAHVMGRPQFMNMQPRMPQPMPHGMPNFQGGGLMPDRPDSGFAQFLAKYGMQRNRTL